MSIQTVLQHGVMEGKGAYNKHARIPAGGAALAIPFLEKAVNKMPVDPEDQPVVIADYGSSQGKNSLAPMQIAIRGLRRRVGPDRAMFVFHVDQPSNDFNSLFEVLSSDPERYADEDRKLFPCAIGRSFYEAVLPPESVHLGWSSYAAVWLSRIPSLIPGHFFPLFSKGAVAAAFERQAAEDWQAFLTLRATELRPGARLIVVLPGTSEHSGFIEVMRRANNVLAEMVDERSITAEERARMVLGSYPRRKEELLAPFTNGSQFGDLILENCDVSPVPDAAWAAYQLDGDKEALAAKQALGFRAIFMPSLASALERVRAGDGEALNRFADRLERGLVQHLAARPISSDTLAQTIVVAKM